MKTSCQQTHHTGLKQIVFALTIILGHSIAMNAKALNLPVHPKTLQYQSSGYAQTIKNPTGSPRAAISMVGRAGAGIHPKTPQYQTKPGGFLKINPLTRTAPNHCPHPKVCKK